MAAVNLTITACSWKDYKNFMHLCSVNTIPYHGGKCWKYESDAGFIGYNFCYRFCPIRAVYFKELKGLDLAGKLDFCNRNIRALSRVMIAAEFRGRGLAKRLINETKNIVGVPFIECIAADERIAGLLEACGFIRIEEAPGNTLRYYVYQVE